MNRRDLSNLVERCAAKMRGEGLPEIAIKAFSENCAIVVSGESGVIPEDRIDPVDALPDASGFSIHEEDGRQALRQTALLKLNGGLGTGMGLSRAKALLEVKPDLTFLDVIARQIMRMRSIHGCPVPLILMNSYRTQADSLHALAKYPELAKDIPLDFLQHKVPRIDVETLEPVVWSEDPSLEWCPPGHGDIYLALVSSGMLRELRDRGYRYLFMSNCDNLGAELDLGILGWVASQEVPFAMEVTRRTPADRKGGHLARGENGRLLLRESAQCSDEDVDAFQDIERHRYFNTNNLWLDLVALEGEIQRQGTFSLPAMRNQKQVAPGREESGQCYQLETAMGAAIGVFEGARAVLVSRQRFAPVKSTDDLLALWSDAYEVAEGGARLRAANPTVARNLCISLDSRHHKTVQGLRACFPHGAPSLKHCRNLRIDGPFQFGRGVVVRGDLSLENESDLVQTIDDHAVLGSEASADSG